MMRDPETCDHGITLEGIVETCADCKTVLVRRPSQELALRFALRDALEIIGHPDDPVVQALWTLAAPPPNPKEGE